MIRTDLDNHGFKIVNNVFTENEVDDILSLVTANSYEGQFGVRELLYDHEELQKKVFNSKLIDIVHTISVNCSKSIKSIYFDKPPTANWIVNWHQDLTINLSNRREVEGYKNWREKDGRFIVQPNDELLEDIFTARIHLDDCNADNGALRVIEGSHKNGPIRIGDWLKDRSGTERMCEVPKGGVLLMKPLTLHASRRTDNGNQRRVIHIEFTDQELPNGLTWKEGIEI